MADASAPAKTDIAHGYDEIATRIGMSENFYAALARFAGPIEAPVLDVGCGGGHLLAFLQEQCGVPPSQCAGLDLSRRLCQLSAQKTGSAIFQADAERLPIRDRQFQTVFMTEVLEHILAPQSVFREIHRVLEEPGRWFLTVPNRDWLRYDHYVQRREKFQPVDDRFYRFSEIQALAKECGLRVVRASGYGSLRHGGQVWGAFEGILMHLMPSLQTKRKRLFVALEKEPAA